MTKYHGRAKLLVRPTLATIQTGPQSRDSRARLLVQSFSTRAAAAEVAIAGSPATGSGDPALSSLVRAATLFQDSAAAALVQGAIEADSVRNRGRRPSSLPDARRDEGVEAVSPLRRQLAAAAAHAGAAADGGARESSGGRGGRRRCAKGAAASGRISGHGGAAWRKRRTGGRRFHGPEAAGHSSGTGPCTCR